MECSVTRLGFFYEAAAVHFDALDMKFLSLTFDHLHSVSGSLKYLSFEFEWQVSNLGEIRE